MVSCQSVELIIVTLLCCCLSLLAAPVKITLEDVEDSNNNVSVGPSPEHDINTAIEDVQKAKVREKRAENQYIQATQASQMKCLRVFLQGFRNIVLPSTNVGGAHPLARESVKPVIKFFKERFVAIFFPDVGSVGEQPPSVRRSNIQQEVRRAVRWRS